VKKTGNESYRQDRNYFLSQEVYGYDAPDKFEPE
jgi:hypothetical protein